MVNASLYALMIVIRICCLTDNVRLHAILKNAIMTMGCAYQAQDVITINIE